MERKTQCPDCQTKMEQGFLPDDVGGNYTQACWHPGGSSERNWLMGIKTIKEKRKPVAAYRCPQCGPLKLYAV